MTPEQNENLLIIAHELDKLNAEMEEKREIVMSKEVDALVKQKNKLLSVFKKLKPIFDTFGGQQMDLMTALPQIMPSITALQADQQLKQDLEEVIALL